MDAHQQAFHAACFELGLLDTEVYREYVLRRDRANVDSLISQARQLLEMVGLDPVLANLYGDMAALEAASQGDEQDTIADAIRKTGDEIAFHVHNLASNLSLWSFVDQGLPSGNQEELVAWAYVREMIRKKYNQFSATYNRKLQAIGVDVILPETWEENDSPADVFQSVLDLMEARYDEE